MSYKLCTRCQFLVVEKRKICNTCGGKKFQAIAGKGAERIAREDAVVQPTPLRAVNAPDAKDAQVARVASSQSGRARAANHRQVVASARPVKMVHPETVGETFGTAYGARHSRPQAVLREKFSSIEPETLESAWWQQTWTRVCKAFNS